jgi:hypothetical protein
MLQGRQRHLPAGSLLTGGSHRFGDGPPSTSLRGNSLSSSFGFFDTDTFTVFVFGELPEDELRNEPRAARLRAARRL